MPQNSPIIYEVNLSLANAIVSDYIAWLNTHIQHMLTFQGFKDAHLWKEHYDDATSHEKNCVNIVVKYTVASLQDLEHYLTHHATTMRQEAQLLFPNQFSATRRILYPLS